MTVPYALPRSGPQVQPTSIWLSNLSVPLLRLMQPWLPWSLATQMRLRRCGKVHEAAVDVQHALAAGGAVAGGNVAYRDTAGNDVAPGLTSIVPWPLLPTMNSYAWSVGVERTAVHDVPAVAVDDSSGAAGVQVAKGADLQVVPAAGVDLHVAAVLDESAGALVSRAHAGLIVAIADAQVAVIHLVVARAVPLAADAQSTVRQASRCWTCGR